MESVLKQTHRDLELVVVDQGSVVTQQQNAATLRLLGDRGIHMTTDERGLSRGRNRGLTLARGDVLAFPDDDCWYEPELLQRVACWFEHNPQFDVLSLPYQEPGVPNPWMRRRSTELRAGSVAKTVCSVGLFVRTRTLAEFGVRFNEHIGAGTRFPAGEEIDFALRLLRGGARGWYASQMTVFHPLLRMRTEDAERRQAREIANTYALAINAANLVVLAMLLKRLFKSACFGVISGSERRVFTARVRGVRLALGAVIRRN